MERIVKPVRPSLERAVQMVLTWGPACLVVGYTLLFFFRFSFVSVDSLFLSWSAVFVLILLASIREKRAPFAPVMLFFFFLLLTVVVAILQKAPATSILGYQYEMTTTVSFLLLAPFFLIGLQAHKIDWHRTTELLFYGLLFSQILFWIYAFVFGALPFVALLFGAIQVFVMIGLLESRSQRGAKLLLYLVGILPAGIALIAVGQTTVLAILACSLLCVLLIGALFQGKNVTERPVTLTISIAIGLLWALASISLVPNFLLVEREGTITWPLYVRVAEETLSLKPTLLIWGQGANQFAKTYEQFKPTEINQTDVWDISFSKAPSFFSELFFVGGIAGITLLVVFLIVCLRRGAGVLREHAYISGSLLFLTLSATFFHLPTPLAIVAATLLGLIASSKAVSSGTRFPRFQKIIPIVIIVLALVMSVHILRTTVSLIFYEKGINALTQELPQEAVENFSRALSYRGHSFVYERRAFAGQILLDQLSENPNPTPEDREEFFSIADRAVGDAEQAFELEPSYRSAMTAGNIHTILFLVGIRSSFGRADFFYIEAKSFAPRNPIPSFARGRLFYLTGEESDTAVIELERALSIKEDFTPAQTFLNSIQNR